MMMNDREQGQGESADDDERRRAADEIATRLRQRGVSLSGQESGEEIVNLLEAVERFEVVVERGGGDLMMDQPVPGADAPIAPDDAAFVLPKRGTRESVATYIGRIADAEIRAAAHREGA